MKIGVGIIAKLAWCAGIGYIVLNSPLPAPADNNERNSMLLSKAKGTLNNLKSESKYEFKAAATRTEANKMGSYNFSALVEKLVPYAWVWGSDQVGTDNIPQRDVICKIVPLQTRSPGYGGIIYSSLITAF